MQTVVLWQEPLKQDSVTWQQRLFKYVDNKAFKTGPDDEFRGIKAFSVHSPFSAVL
jgi:hypothetical protein